MMAILAILLDEYFRVANAYEILLEDYSKLQNEIDRLHRAKEIVLGECKVAICSAYAAKSKTKCEDEVLILDAEACTKQPTCIGEPCDEFRGTLIENSDERLLARLVIKHPNGAAILIEKLESAMDEKEREMAANNKEE